MGYLKNIILLCATLPVSLYAPAQQPNTEFTRGWLLNLKLASGAITNFSSRTADSYTGSLLLNPQVTVVQGTLRLGMHLGGAYNYKKLSGYWGPMAALRLVTLGTKNFGTLANMHLLAEANWGTNRQQMAGGGLGFEILSLAHIGITVQRDYKQNNWWLQSFIAVRLNRQKPVTDRYAQ